MQSNGPRRSLRPKATLKVRDPLIFIEGTEEFGGGDAVDDDG